MDKIYSSIKLNFASKKRQYWLIVSGLLLISITAYLVTLYFDYYQMRFYPRTYINELNISGLTQEEAQAKILAALNQQINFETDSLSFVYQDATLSANLKELGINSNLDEILQKAFLIGHQGNVIERLQQIVYNHLKPNKLYLGITYDQSVIQNLILEFKNQVDFAGEEPQLSLSHGTITVNSGQTANTLLNDETWQKIYEQLLSQKLQQLTHRDLTVEVVVDHPIVALNPLQIENSQVRASKFIDQQLSLNYEYQQVLLTASDLLSFLALPEGFKDKSLDNYLEQLKKEINRPSSNAQFDYDPNTLQVSTFIPDQDGLEIDLDASRQLIKNFLLAIENDTETAHAFDLPMTNSKAEITLADTNDLGINEVIGFGESWYAHSIANRIYNVNLTTQRISNHIVKPGAEFSFNQALGEVSEATGFKNAYIIEAGETKLAPGGGVCQVSSTLFRALLNAGVDVTLRLPHAYRVSYYEIGNEPGFDATVYAGNTDLRFINDTSHYLLINCQADSDNLYMFCKLYGTSDGRHTEITKYKKWDQTPALATVYIPDTSLAPGKLEQIDWAASGIKTEFTNVIYDASNQIIREDYYYSNYHPWAAKFLQGI